MNLVDVRFKNCFGIEDLEYSFDFSDDNVFAIYARNGLMKTSFAKTMQYIQLSKEKDIGDVVFSIPGSADVSIDGEKAAAGNIFVVKSYESSYESDISPLLIKDDVKSQLKDVLIARDRFLKSLENLSGLKVKKTSGGKAIYEIETAILDDFDFAEKSILLNIDTLAGMVYEKVSSGINYSAIFDAGVQKKILSDEFQNSIQKYIDGSNQVYDSFDFLEKGNLTLPKLKDVKKALEKDSFFVKDNSVILAGRDQLTTVKALAGKIKEVDDAIKSMPELKAIEGLLGDVKGSALKDVIETHPEVIPYLTRDKLTDLRRMLWLSYIDAVREQFDDLKNKTSVLSTMLEKLDVNDSAWKQALDIFNKRFSVPFSMTVSNLKGAVMGESIPQIEFAFEKDGDKVKIDRSRLEEIDTLSQGEKRALFLLNIIFDLEQLKRSGEEKLLIVDDIADSFDYKNKYAIIEYLCELADNPKFKLIILTHNFDFYRTVIMRIPIPRAHGLIADLGTNNKITISQSDYQSQPFSLWKRHPHKMLVIAMIPFVRNIIEYGKDRNITGGGKNKDYLLLTSLLHEKPDTNIITFQDILPLFREYIGIDSFEPDINMTDKVIEEIYKLCENITEHNTGLEYKIILSIAIRHKAEKYMMARIASHVGTLIWGKGGNLKSGNGTDFLSFIDGKKNQTRELINGYRQFGDDQTLKIMSEVNIMTPENIHFNSFMFEPILDMDITELLGLYKNVDNL